MRLAFRKPIILPTLAILIFLLVPSTSLANQKVYLTSCCGDGATVSILDSMMLMEMGFIPARTGTTAVAIGPDSMTAYIGLSNGQAGVVEEVDTMTGTVMMTFPAGNGAAAIAITPDGSTGYVANKNDGSVTIFDTATGTIKANLAILPNGACLDAGISPDGSKAYVVCQVTNGKHSQSVLAIIANNQVLKAISLPGSQPFPGNNLLAITPDGTRAYIAGISTQKQTGFAAVDLTAERVLRFFALPSMSYGLAVHPMFPHVLFSSGAGVLNYIDADTGKIQGTTSVGSSGKGGVVPFMGGMRVAVASVDDDVVAVVDNTDGRLASTISAGAMPQRLVISKNEMMSLVGTTYTTVVHEFDAVTGQWLADFEAGTAPAGLVLSPDGSMAYVVDQGMTGSGSGSGIVALDMMMMGERQWRIAIPGASSVAIRPDGRALYVGSSTGSVSVINTRNGALAHTISLGSINGSPSLVASPDNKSLYATYTQTGGQNVLSIVATSTNKISATIPLGGGASSAGPFLALSPDGSRGYVTLMSQSQIAIVDLIHQQLLQTVSVGSGVNPACIAIHPKGMTAYVVANSGVLVFDLASNTVAGTTPVSGTPQNVAFTADGSMAYVSVVQGQAAVIDTAIDRVIELLPAANTLGVTISAH